MNGLECYFVNYVTIDDCWNHAIDAIWDEKGSYPDFLFKIFKQELYKYGHKLNDISIKRYINDRIQEDKD